MTQPEANPSLPEEAKLSSAAASTATETASGDADADAETEPQPEPWTPRRVTEWNAYYDIYVMLAALLLAFVVSAVRVDESNAILWAHLKTGEIMAQQGAPV